MDLPATQGIASRARVSRPVRPHPGAVRLLTAGRRSLSWLEQRNHNPRVGGSSPPAATFPRPFRTETKRRQWQPESESRSRLACTECKRRNYQTEKSKRNTPDRVEFKKYCRWCGQPHCCTGRPASADGPPDSPSAERDDAAQAPARERGRDQRRARRSRPQHGRRRPARPAASAAQRPAASSRESLGRAQEGRVAGPAAGDPGHGRRHRSPASSSAPILCIADQVVHAVSSSNVLLALGGRANVPLVRRSTPTPGTRTR